MIFRKFKQRTLNDKDQRTLINGNRPSVDVMDGSTSIDRSSRDKWESREWWTDAWVKGISVTWWSAVWQVGQTACSVSLRTVLIDSETAAGPRWVIGWFFFSPPPSVFWDRPRPWQSNGHIVALMNISRLRHNEGGARLCRCWKLQGNLGDYPEYL